MKKIEAIIKSASVNSVRDALDSIGISSVMVSDVEFLDRRKGGQAIWCPSVYCVGRPAESKIELTVPDAQAEGAVTTIVRAAQIVEMGQDDTFVSTVGDAIRMETVAGDEMSLGE